MEAEAGISEEIYSAEWVSRHIWTCNSARCVRRHLWRYLQCRVSNQASVHDVGWNPFPCSACPALFRLVMMVWVSFFLFHWAHTTLLTDTVTTKYHTLQIQLSPHTTLLTDIVFNPYDTLWIQLSPHTTLLTDIVTTPYHTLQIQLSLSPHTTLLTDIVTTPYLLFR
jgi:hypothetical protein